MATYWTLTRKENKRGFGHKLVPKKIHALDEQEHGFYFTKSDAIKSSKK